MRVRAGRWWLAGYLAVTLIALLRVAATHGVFSHTLDEPAHLAAGYEWVARGSYSVDVAHPPLARILAALPLSWEGIPPPKTGNMVKQGKEILYFGDRYEHNLTLARKGNLLLLILGIAAIALWARRWFTEPMPLLATALFTSLPPILAHAGLITTDLAVTAALPLALYALDLFVERSTPRRGLLLGLALAIGVLSKFSFLLFFPICALFVVLAHRGRGAVQWRGVVTALAITLFVAWGGYRFHVGKMADLRPDADALVSALVPHSLEPAASRISRRVPIPAPAYVLGVGMVRAHDARGHDAYLLGDHSRTGWWYYFPVVFFYKTPVPFLVLVALGSLVVARRRSGWIFPVTAAAIMVSVMPSSINIGVRHVLPVYGPLSIVAAVALVEIWRRSRARLVRLSLAGLLVWSVATSTRAHPDYLAWFNILAGPEPGRIAVDSNLDWGQDILRLRRVLHERGIEHLRGSLLSNADLEKHGIRMQRLSPTERGTGWIAISESALRLGRSRGMYRWLDAYRPVQRVGKSIRLYYIPRGQTHRVAFGARHVAQIRLSRSGFPRSGVPALGRDFVCPPCPLGIGRSHRRRHAARRPPGNLRL